MIDLHLTRGGSSLRVPLRLPATPAKEAEAFAKLDTISADARTTRIAEVITSIPNLAGYIRSADINGPDFAKLKRLAERLDNMTEREQPIFSGALDAESINGLDDVLRVADSLDNYTIIKEVTCDRALGGYLVKHGYLQCPEELRLYLDYVAIGAEFYADHGGAYEPKGYVLRKSELPPFLNRLCDPEPWRDEDREEIICLKLENASQQYTLVLPADNEYMEDVCQYLGIDSFASVKIAGASCLIPGLSDLIPWDCVNVEDANDLALAVEEMQETDGELLKFCSALEVEQPQTFQAALRLAMDLDDYERVPDDKEEYGKEVLRRIEADDEVIDSIDGYMNFRCFGEDMMIEDGVRRTEFGLLRRISEPLPSQQQGKSFSRLQTKTVVVVVAVTSEGRCKNAGKRNNGGVRPY